MLFQLAGLLPTRARSPPRAARETRHMSSAPENGLAIFSGSRSCRCLYVVSAQIAGRGPHAHIPCPGLCWCRGLGRRRAQRLPASCHETALGFTRAASGGLYPAAPGPQDTCSEPSGFAPPGIEGWPASNLLLLSAGLGAFLLIFSFVLGVIVGGCGGFCLGYLWSSAGRSSGQHYGWPRVAGYLRPPSAA